MALEPYSPCPCGSGKKFKWCCQPIHIELNKAYEQDAEGQHEVALRTIDQVVAAHPDNPEVWGRKAELLYRNGKPDDAETALQKAFEINPNYPFGHLLQGSFRQSEGEIGGALLLYRRAVELFDPEARGVSGQLHVLIFQCEIKFNRPIAAHAALNLAIHLDPASEELRQALEGYFGEQSQLPASAKRDYKFLAPSGTLPADRRSVWDQALARAGTGKLADAAKAFAQVAEADQENAAAWYNLAIARAWLGDNRGALEALDRYVPLEPDEGRAAAAWALGEVLRMGQGMEAQADTVDHSVVFRIQDPERVSGCLNEWHRERRLLVLQAREDQPIFSAMVLEKVTALTPELARSRPPHLGAMLDIVGNILRLGNSRPEALRQLREELLQKVGSGLADERAADGPANFNDVLSEGRVFPIHSKDEAEAKQVMEDELQRWFEETWIHKPLRSLGGVPPIDAAGHATLKKKLAGVLQFMQECASAGKQTAYDFDRLRRKLGGVTPESAAPAAPGSTLDIGSMATAELAALGVESLSDEQLELAYQAAGKLDARDLASRFAKALVSRPPQPGRPDRYPWFGYLVDTALREGDTAAALNHVNEGLKDDSVNNEARRRNDYDLRRGQIHAKRGEADLAQNVFEQLIERMPSELRYRGSAAEAMLSAKEGRRALPFAEAGLKKARELNNRDSEQYFLELVEAAKRQAK